MAIIKRKTRVSNRGGLTDGQKDNLIGGMASLLTNNTTNEADPLFKDDAHRKEVYLSNKEIILKECREDRGPGCRPGGFWDYETELTDKASEYLKHEYLIKNNLLFIGELDQIIADWLHIFDAHREGLQGRYRNYKKGGKIYHGPEWPVEADKWGKEAELYGGRALKAWKKLLAEAEEGGGE
jgi:hypothetical protein